MSKCIGIIILLSIFMGGCVLTKVVTVPMRAVGAVVSVVPVVGDKAHASIDAAAAVVDEVPL